MKRSLIQDNSITISEGFDLFISNRKSKNVSVHTITHYTNSWRQIIKCLDPSTPASSVNIDTWESLILQLQQKDIKDRTVTTYVKDFRTICGYFFEQEWTKPFKFTIPKAETAHIECYSDSDIAKILKKPNLKTCIFSEYKQWVACSLLLSVGIRKRSLLNIRIKDIDFDNCVLYVNTTKNRKPLIIPLHDEIISILKEYLKFRQHQSEDDFLICTAFGKPYENDCSFNVAINNFLAKRKVGKTGIHRFRHTFARKFIMNGGSVVTLQKILGHSSLEITQIYLNLLVEDTRADIEKTNILREFKSETIKMR